MMYTCKLVDQEVLEWLVELQEKESLLDKEEIATVVVSFIMAWVGDNMADCCGVNGTLYTFRM